MLSTTIMVTIGIIVFLLIMIGVALASWYKKVPQGQAIVRTGVGGTKVVFDNGIMVIPVFHIAERMDLAVKTVEIARLKEDGLICKDNMRADIKVVFFVRVNQEASDIKKVAQTIGTVRASDPEVLRNLFEAKFSEALKTAGKRFEFVKLYDNRREFKSAILDIIGDDLNGYVLDDAAIDYLEQTPVQYLQENNILDAEGIKKIAELTAAQKVKANFIRREEEKTLKEQNVEAREAILEYERQLAEKEERQKREIANIKARENAEIAKINEEERLRSESVRIRTEEELQIQEENKLRQVIIAAKNKERAEAVETERVEKDRMLEATERERVVTLAEIEKQRAIEEEQKNIQDVIRERVMVEKKTVEEEEKIKDTREVAAANRAKQVAVIKAEEIGDAMVIEETQKAEAARQAAEIEAKKILIDAEASMKAAEKEAEARKIQAEAKAAEEATIGLSEAQVIEAKAMAREREGMIEASIMEKKAQAEAAGISAKADANHKEGLLQAEVIAEQGTAEAKAMQERMIAEAKGVEEKALAMQKLDGVGKEHEEFKLRLEQEKAIQLAAIEVDRHIAEAQAVTLGEAFKSANIDIVGGEAQFVNNIMNSVTRGKSIDRLIGGSKTLSEIKTSLLGDGGNGNLFGRIRELADTAGVKSADLKNLSLAALLLQLRSNASGEEQSIIGDLMEVVQSLGLGDENAGKLL